MRVVVGILALLFCWGAAAQKVDNSTLDRKLILGYQGWFACPGDARGRGWDHWKNGRGEATVDLLPDVAELAPDELCESGWTARDGKPELVFSSQNARTVDRHFAWMESYGLDGVGLQKFALGLLHPDPSGAWARVLANVRAGAAAHGRVYYVMYDLAGFPADQIDLVAQDWRRLLEAGVARDPAYLRHKGRPLLGVVGLGFSGSAVTPAPAARLLDLLREVSAPYGGVTIQAIVAADWRERSAETGWPDIWRRLDVISAWTVGAFREDAGADNYRRDRLAPDLDWARENGVDLMPVVFPGFSWVNLQRANGHPENAIPNVIPRRCGAFYAHQVANVLGAGAHMIFTAMFDEVDEGTAMFKLAPKTDDTPMAPFFLALDADGCALASDYYLRLAGAATRALRRGAPDFVTTPPR